MEFTVAVARVIIIQALQLPDRPTGQHSSRLSSSVDAELAALAGPEGIATFAVAAAP